MAAAASSPGNGLAWVETSTGRERKEVGRFGHHFNCRATEGLTLGADVTKVTVETASRFQTLL